MTNTMEELMPMIRRASKSVASQWPGVIEAEDAEQSIALHLLERPSSIAKILGMDSKARYRAIVGIGHQIASKARAEFDLYKGSYYYSAKEVKGFLSHGILFDQPKFRAEKLDVEDAMEKIATQYQAAIIHRYMGGEVPTIKSEKDALSNGLTALVDAMNSVHRRRQSERDDGPGSRKAITKSQARAISRMQYNGSSDEDDEYESYETFDRFSTGGFR